MTLTIIAIVLALLGGSLYALLRAHEEAKDERQRFNRIAQANSESRTWPPPSGPKGFDRNRRKAA